MSAPERQAARTALVPIVVAGLQAVVKAVVGASIGSLAVLASALDSLLDVGLSTVNLLSIRKAGQPADEEHPFGHGKVESLAVLLQGAVIAGSAIFLAFRGIQGLTAPEPLRDWELGGLAMALALVLSLALSRYLVRRARETGSRALHADSLHYASDVWTSGAILAALSLQSLSGAAWIDPAFSLAVAAWILWQVRPLLRGAVDELVDRELGGEERRRIERILSEHAPEILDYHRLRTRRAGPQRTVDVHVVICRERPFEEAHAIVSRLEHAIQAEIPNADVLVHADPCSSAPVRCPGPHRVQRTGPGASPGRVYYETVHELPADLRERLPAEARERYVAAFNAAYARTGSAEAADRAGALALEPEFERRGDRWIPRRQRA